MLKPAIGRIVSGILTAGGWLLAGARLGLDLVGYSTAPEDLAVAQSRLNQAIGYLLQMPWWVPLGFATLATVWLMHVSWPRAPRLTAPPSVAGDQSPRAESALSVAGGEARKLGMGRVAALLAPKPNFILTEAGLADLHKLIDVTLRTGDAQFGTAVKAVIRGFDTVQDGAGIEIRNMSLYLYIENQNTVMTQLASLIRQDRAPPKSAEIAEKFIVYLDYYRNIQTRMIDVVLKLGATDETREAVRQWLPTDRDIIQQIQSLASAHLKNERLRQIAWDVGFADSRFRAFLKG